MTPSGPAAQPGLVRRRRIVALAVWLLLMALAALAISRLAFTADLSAFLPKSPDPRQQVLIDQIESGVASRSLMLAIGGGDAAQRRLASRQLAAALRSSGRFEQVHNGDRSDERWQAAGRWLFENRYLLSPAVDPQRFGVDGLAEAIDESLSLLGTPAGAALQPILERDPTGETRRIAESLLPADAPRSDGGVWVSRDAQQVLLLATLRGAGADLDRIDETLADVRRLFAPLAADGLQLAISGTPVFAVQSRAQIQHEVKLLAIAGSVVVGGMLLLAFASVSALAVALLPVVSGVVGGVLAVGLVFGDVHGITLAFGSTLIGESVDYAIYYLIQARGASADGSGWRRWRASNWPTVRLGLLTSICGFAALLFSGFPGLAQLGMFSIAGLSAAALTTRLLLPRLVPDGAAGAGARRALAWLAQHAVDRLPLLRWPVLLLGVAAALWLVGQGGQLWRGSLASLSPVPAEAQALDARLRADLGASDARTLVLANGADLETALQAAEAVAPRLDALVAEGLLAGYETPARLLPSRQRQQQRRDSLPPAAALQQRLQAATEGGPLPASRLAPFVADVEQARQRPPVDRAALDGSVFEPVVGALLFERRGGGWSAMLALHPAGDAELAEPVRRALAGLAPAHEVLVVDIKAELDDLYAHYLRQALLQSLLGAAGVVLLLALHLRSARRLARVCLPLALAVLLTLGALALFDVELGILHLVGLLLVIAVGSNYGLFFDQLRSDGRADPDTLASLLLANLTTVVSFGLIALSEIPALSAIGRVVAPGALLALLLATVMSNVGRPRARTV